MNQAHLVALGIETTHRADELNRLVYTAHMDTLSYNNTHFHNHAWMPLAANTADNWTALAQLTQ